MELFITHRITQAAMNAFTLDEARYENFVLVVDMGMNDFSVIDYDNSFNALIPTVVELLKALFTLLTVN